jgi:type IV pilus assembly protein PilN
VILINLLPHREVARKRRRDVFNITLAASFFLGLLISGAIYLWFQGRISEQQSQNRVLQSEIKRLEGQIKDIASLETEIAALRARQQAVEDLQSDRNVPVHLMTELAKQLPDGVYVSNMKQENQNVTMQGVAQSNERVSELLRNLAKNTPWFSRPELVEIVASTVTLSPRDVKRVMNFTMRVQLMRASEAEKAVPVAAAVVAAAAAAPAASAPVKK